MVRIDAVHTAGADNGQHPFGKAQTGAGLGAKANFSPLHRRPDGTFGNVIGGLDAPHL